MTREEAKEEAKRRTEEVLAHYGVDVDKARSNTNCPLCGSGTGAHKSGAFHYYADTRRWCCFSCNAKGGDVFDFYAAKEGLADGGSRAAMEGVYNLLGITLDAGGETTHTHTHTHAESPTVPSRMARTRAREGLSAAVGAAPAMDGGTYVSFFDACAAALVDGSAGADFLLNRGIRLEVAKEYGIGFEAEYKGHPRPRLIIPLSDRAYIERDTREEGELAEAERKYYHRYRNVYGSWTDAEGNTHKAVNAPFGWRQIADFSRPLYVVEGWADALSIISVGGSAVALNSTANVAQFVKEYAPQIKAAGGRLVLSLDTDEAGRKAEAELEKGLLALGVDFIASNVAGSHKDANEAYFADWGFEARVLQTAQDYERRRAAVAEVAAKEYRDRNSAAGAIGSFIDELKRGKEYTSSGFPLLDKAISGWEGGGLPNGLYVIGAISSLGKTTFILQMADQMAAAGRDVAIFSLEMGRSELIGKSLSRLSGIEALGEWTGRGGKCALDAVAGMGYSWGDFRDWKRKSESYRDFSLSEDDIARYSRRYIDGGGSRVFIEEGAMGGTTIEQIRAKVEEIRRVTGKPPVVFIDYLQMVAAPAGMESATDKQTTDRKILDCKVMSRELGTPVIAISSLNRQSYFSPMALDAFKESGSIEYSADVVLGLQFPIMEQVKKDEQGRKVEQFLKERTKVREVEVKVLKNRNGGMADRPRYYFLPRLNLFIEMTEEEAAEARKREPQLNDMK